MEGIISQFSAIMTNKHLGGGGVQSCHSYNRNVIELFVICSSLDMIFFNQYSTQSVVVKKEKCVIL